MSLTVGDGGMFCAAAEGEAAAVAVEFSSDAPFRLLSEHGDIFAAAHLTGSATFAETLAFVFRNLRWDVEADLADIVGDIPARRIARAAAAGLAWHRAAIARLGANVTEFASEESRLVVPTRELAEFAGPLSTSCATTSHGSRSASRGCHEPDPITRIEKGQPRLPFPLPQGELSESPCADAEWPGSARWPGRARLRPPRSRSRPGGWPAPLRHASSLPSPWLRPGRGHESPCRPAP